MYTYQAKVEKVIDGDTVRLEIDLGFRVKWSSNCRLAGINTPELGRGGEEARDFVSKALPVGSKIQVVSKSLDKYGRPIVEISYQDSTLNKVLIDNNLAKAY